MVTKQLSLQSSAAVLGPFYRTDLEIDSLQSYVIPLTNMRVHDAMQTVLPGTAANDDMGLITGTPGTDVPTLQGVDFGGTTSDEKAGFQFVLPPEYYSGGQIQVVVRAAMLTAIADTSCTVDVQCWPQDDNGAAAADICATSAQNMNSLTPANYTFTITATNRLPGDVLNIRLAFAGTDAGNLAVMIPEISKVTVKLDIRG
jgi:hypothetical protein